MNELRLTVEPKELWDPIKEEFVYLDKPVKLRLKHSLLSIVEWESRHKKSFFTERDAGTDEFIDYIRCMTMNGEFEDAVYNSLTASQLKEIEAYMDDPTSACTFLDFNDSKTRYSKRYGKKITSEDIYYTMFELGIPIDCEKWHFNRLIALIRYFEIKNGGSKKMSREKTVSTYAALNAARRAKHKTKG